MPGLPLEQFDRAFRPASGVIVDTSVLYEVWREYAIGGPQHEQRLLLKLREHHRTPPASQVANLLQRRARKHPPPHPTIGVIGEWIWIRADLDQLVRDIMPYTRWGRLLRILARLDLVAVMQLLTPLEELLKQGTQVMGPPAQGAEEDAAAGEEVVRERFTERDQEALSWLVRLLVRIYGFDADFDSEREDAAAQLLGVLAPLLSDGRLRPAPHVIAVSIDRIASVASTSSTPRTPVSLSTKVIKADAARLLFKIDTSAQTWAILDTGINAKHPAFADHSDGGGGTRITDTFDLTTVSDEELPQPGGKPNPVDDLEDLVQAHAVPAFRRIDESSGYKEPVDPHGTHVAGILAADWPGKLQGICPDLRLWDMRVLAREGVESRILMALRFIRHYNDRAGRLVVCGANLSLSIPYDPRNHACGWTPVCEEVRRLVRSGVVVVVAAGNSGYKPAQERGTSGQMGMDVQSQGTGFQVVSVTDPANAEEAITVGATHEQHPHRYGASYFSGKGPTADGRVKPDLLAPGENIRGPAGSDGAFRMDGTSQATPHVAGAAALLIGRYAELRGQPERIKQILCDTATDLGRDRYFQGHGVVDVLRAAQST